MDRGEGFTTGRSRHVCPWGPLAGGGEERLSRTSWSRMEGGDQVVESRLGDIEIERA